MCLTGQGSVLSLTLTPRYARCCVGDGDGNARSVASEAGRPKENDREASREYPTGSTGEFTGVRLAGKFIHEILTPGCNYSVWYDYLASTAQA